MKGYVDIKYKKNGKLLHEESHNLIVNQAGLITAGLLATSGVSGITKFIVGDNNVNTTNKDTTSLGGNTYSNSVGTITVTAGQVSIPFTLSTSEFNGYDIWQFGLMTTDNQLFSILSRQSLGSPPTISKDSDMDVEGTWVITADI